MASPSAIIAPLSPRRPPALDRPRPVTPPLTHPAPEPIAQSLAAASGGRLRACVGIDTVALAHLSESLDAFGERFTQRLFTPAEQADAASQATGRVARLAARFAAKEATIKALGLSDVGVDWRHIEVRRAADGAPTLHLQGRALAQAQALGVHGLSVSLSHDGGQACAVVVGLADAYVPANAPASVPANMPTSVPASAPALAATANPFLFTPSKDAS